MGGGAERRRNGGEGRRERGGRACVGGGRGRYCRRGGSGGGPTSAGHLRRHTRRSPLPQAWLATLFSTHFLSLSLSLCEDAGFCDGFVLVLSLSLCPSVLFSTHLLTLSLVSLSLSTCERYGLVDGFLLVLCEGIMFNDITTLLLRPKVFKDAVDILVDRYRDMAISAVAGSTPSSTILPYLRSLSLPLSDCSLTAGACMLVCATAASFPPTPLDGNRKV